MSRVLSMFTRKMLGPAAIMEDGNPIPVQYRGFRVAPADYEGDGAPTAPVGDNSPTDSDVEPLTPTL
jgi:hypothetical protein